MCHRSFYNLPSEREELRGSGEMRGEQQRVETESETPTVAAPRERNHGKREEETRGFRV
jgi:hypothetical protein